MTDEPQAVPRKPRRELAEPIPDTLDNIAAAVMQAPAKKNWRYERKG